MIASDKSMTEQFISVAKPAKLSACCEINEVPCCMTLEILPVDVVLLFRTKILVASRQETVLGRADESRCSRDPENLCRAFMA